MPTRQERKANKMQDKELRRLKKLEKKTGSNAKKEVEFTATIQKDNKKKLVVIILWCMLGFIFFRGIIASIQANPEQEMQQQILQFTQNYQAESAKITEVSAFAQNFMKEYSTYAKGREDDYKKRLSAYTDSKLLEELVSGVHFASEADAVYCQTISVKQYGKNQYDVLVLVDVLYQKYFTPTPQNSGQQPVMAEDLTEKKTLYYNIPVCVGGGKYIIEDLPVTVARPDNLAYTRAGQAGTTVSEGEKVVITQTVTDFLKTLYEEPQSKINYYLADGVEQEKFKALDTSLSFVKVDDVTSYQQANGTFLAMTTIKVKDSNGSEFTQRFNIVLAKTDKYYIQDLNLRTYNLK